MEVLGRAFQAEKINAYKPEGKNEVGGSIEEMVSQCRGIMGARGQGRDLLYYFTTPTQVYVESIIQTLPFPLIFSQLPLTCPSQSTTRWFSS